jgi:hypothetical protein
MSALQLELFEETRGELLFSLLSPLRHLMRTANAANYFGEEKERYFYPLKAWLLKRFGKFICYDTQRIKQPCWSCDGTGRWHYWYDDGGEWCYKCRGTGVYAVKWYLLERWLLWGDIYHRPAWWQPWRLAPIRAHYNGKLKHPSIDPIVGHRALSWLLLIFKPRWYFQRLEKSFRFGMSNWHCNVVYWRYDRIIKPILEYCELIGLQSDMLEHEGPYDF